MDGKENKTKTNFIFNIDVELDNGEHIEVWCDILTRSERKELVEKIWQKGFWDQAYFYPAHRIKRILI